MHIRLKNSHHPNGDPCVEIVRRTIENRSRAPQAVRVFPGGEERAGQANFTAA